MLAICANWPQSDTKSLGAAFSDYFSLRSFSPQKMSASSPQPSSPVQGCWGAVFKMHNGHRCFPSASHAIRNSIPQLGPSETQISHTPQSRAQLSPTQQEPGMETVNRYQCPWHETAHWVTGKQKWWCRSKKNITWVTQTYLERFCWFFFPFFFLLHRHKCLKLKSKRSQSYFTPTQCRTHCS